jgi:hypothetical protein
VILGTFFLSILGIKQTRHSALGGQVTDDSPFNPSDEPATAHRL